MPGYGIDGGSLVALDPVKQSLYFFGMTAPYVAEAPFFLVQASLTDASVLSVSGRALCSGSNAWLYCPRSLAFAN